MRRDTVLLVTASYDFGSEYVIRALQTRHVPTFRLNTDEMATSVRASYRPGSGIHLDCGGQHVQAGQIKSVWYRRHSSPELPDGMDEGVRDFCERETRAFVAGALASLSTVRWLNAPGPMATAERKPYQLSVATQMGFDIPATLITNDPTKLQSFSGGRRLICKAVSTGYIKSAEGNKAIFTTALDSLDLLELEGLPLSPVLFQELVEKRSDIRVTVVGGRVYAAEILSQEREASRVDWRATDDPALEHRTHELPGNVAYMCRELLRRLGLGFGAIDLILRPEGDYVFLEINPSGEWAWIEDRLGLPISGAIAEWLDVAVA